MMRALLLIAGMLLPMGAAMACSCKPVGPCTGASIAGASFVGTVIDEGSSNNFGPIHVKQIRPVRFRVHEVLRGFPARISKVSVLSVGSCQAGFRRGVKYMVFAYPAENGVLYTDICMQSFPVAENRLTADAIRLAQRKGTSSLVGSVLRSRSPIYYASGAEPRAGVRVLASSGSKQLETRTDAKGEFAFFNIAPATYRLSVPPTDYYEQAQFREVKDLVVAAGSCQDKTIYVWPNTSIAGTVRNREGRPIAGVLVKAYGKDHQNQWASTAFREARTSADGTYLLRGLPENGVIIGIEGNTKVTEGPSAYHFYPNANTRSTAKVLKLGEGELRSGIDLTLGSEKSLGTLPPAVRPR